MKTQAITLAADQTQYFATGGAYFEIVSGAHDLSVYFEGDNGEQLDPLEGVKEGVFVTQRYRGFRIVNGPTAQTIKVLIGGTNGGNRAAPLTGTVSVTGPVAIGGTVAVSGGLTDAQLRAAPVPVVQDVKSRADAGQTYAAADYYTVGAATQSGLLALYNPPGSGRDICIQALEVFGFGNNQVSVTKWTASGAFSGITGAATSVGKVATTSVVKLDSVNNSATATEAEMLAAAGLTAPALVQVIKNAYAGSGVALLEVKTPGLIVIEPGECLVVSTGSASAAATVQVNAEWVER